MKQAVHITHEAAKKIGGIGAVLSGMCTSNTYLKQFDRTIFYGPLFDDRPNPNNDITIAIERLGGNAEVIYSSLDGIKNSEYNDFFQKLIDEYRIDIIYGKKTLYDEIDPKKYIHIEILLLGIKDMNPTLLNEFKFNIWIAYGFSHIVILFLSGTLPNLAIC